MTKRFQLISFLFIYGMFISENLNASFPDDPTDCDIEVLVPEDLHICFDEEFQLGGEIMGDYDAYVWIENFSETNYDLNEEVSVDGTSFFTLRAWYQSEENIIINGDFEDGISDFTTDYVVGTSSCFGLGYLDCEGTYDVIDNPNDGHANFASCSDVEGGGNMMVVNGAASLQEIWCQEVCVNEGVEYIFSAWATSVNPSSPAELQFSIDGNLIGELFSLSSDLCNWEEFEASWTASASTTVEICVTNQNTNAGGNDFALDNIGFFQTCADQASFMVTQSDFEIDLEGLDALSCSKPSTDGLALVSPIDNYFFELYLEGSFVDEDAGEDFYFEIDIPGEYTLHVTDDYGCEKQIEFEVEEDFDNPDLDLYVTNVIDCLNPIATLQAESNDRSIIFNWYNENGDFIAEDDDIDIGLEGLYFAEAIDPDNGCITIDSIFVNSDDELPFVELSASGLLGCSMPQTALIADHNASQVSWFNNDGELILQNQDTLLVDYIGNYYVIVMNENGCVNRDSILVTFNESDLDYNLNFNDTINCSEPSSTLNFTLDTLLFSISWQDSSVTNVSSTQFIIESAGEFVFTISDSLNCSISDTIYIEEDFGIADYTITADSISCKSPEAEVKFLSQDSTLQIEWLFEGDTLSSNFLSVASPGQLDYLISSKNGCTEKGSIEIFNSVSLPEVEIFGNNIDCNTPETVLYYSITGDADQHFWMLPDSTLATVDTLVSNIPGVYTLTVEDLQGCEQTKSIAVSIDTLKPILELPSDLELTCDSIRFNGLLAIASGYESIITEGIWLDTASLAYEISEPGEYMLTVQGTNGCETSKSMLVTSDTLPPQFSIQDSFLLNCNENEIVLSPDITSEYSEILWQYENMSSNNDSIKITTESTVSLQVFSDNGCRSDEMIKVYSDFKTPEFSITPDTITCNDQTAQIILEGDDDIVYYYVGVNSEDSIRTAQYETTETGLFSFTAVASNGCVTEKETSIISDTVRVDFIPTADTLTCSNESTEIVLESEESISSFTVEDSSGISFEGLGKPIFNPGLYTVSVINDNGCITEKELEIIEQIETPSIDDLYAEDLNCEEVSSLFEVEISGGQGPYKLYIDNTAVELNTLPYNIYGAGSHTLNIIDANGCIVDTTLLIDEVKPLELQTLTELSIAFGSSIQLEVETNKLPDEILDISWYPETGLSCYDCLNPIFSGINNSEYLVTVTDIYGCMNSIKLRISLLRDIRYYVPNIIDINSTENNRFTIFDQEQDINIILTLQIFDRWGNNVFRRDDFNAGEKELGWDGYFNNKKVEQGVYTYMAKLLLANDELEIISGDLTVLR